MNKKGILFVGLFTVIAIISFAQQTTFAVEPFGVKNGITSDIAEVVTSLFIAELAKNNEVRIVDISNADLVIKGNVMSLAGRTIIQTTIRNKASWQVISGSATWFTDVGQIFDQMPRITQNTFNAYKQAIDPNQSHSKQRQYYVLMSPLEIRGTGITTDEVDVLTDLFTVYLLGRNVRVIDRDTVNNYTRQTGFQVADWSIDTKVMELSRTMLTNSILRGNVMTLAGRTVITASILDSNAQIISSSTLQMDNIGEIFQKISDFAQTIANNLPWPPDYNPLVGRWQGFVGFHRDSWVNHNNSPSGLICILNIQANGTIIVERYDTVTYTQRTTTRTFSSDERSATWGPPNRNGIGNGTYSIIERSNNRIRATFTLNVSGTVGPNINKSVTAQIDLTQPHIMEMHGDINTLEATYQTRFENGRQVDQNWRGNSFGGGYRYFSKLN